MTGRSSPVVLEWHDCAHPDVEILHVRGEVDLSSYPSLRARVLEAAGRGHHLVVDLAGTQFFDATGLRALAEGAEACHARRRLLVVAQASARATRLMEIAGLTVPAARSIESALALVAGAAIEDAGPGGIAARAGPAHESPAR